MDGHTRPRPADRVVLWPEQTAEPELDKRNDPIGAIAAHSAQLKESDRLEAQLRVPDSERR
jgi:hypothetical protein